MKALYHDMCAHDPDKWMKGRGLKKIAAIDESIVYDALDNSRVNLMLKKEVNIVHLGSRQLPSKARGIQFCTNLRTAYENATEQTSFCHSLARSSETQVTFQGVRFLIRYTAEMSPAEIGEFATESENHRAGFKQSFLDERDGKNWDANVQREHREALADWYAEFSTKLSTMARAQIKVTGKYTKNGVKIGYTIDGTVKSGHWDTSSGNGALNLEITTQAIVRLPVDVRPVEVRGLIMGDDLLLWLYFDRKVSAQAYAVAINTAEQELGIHPVRGIFDDVLQVSFCSMGFYRTTDGGVVALPKLGRMFAKLFWTVTPLQGRCPARLASSIAHAFLPTYNSYRPMREFLKHHMKVPPLEENCMGSYSYVLRDFELPRVDGILWHECNVIKYGITPDSLDQMEEMLERCPTGVIQHPVVDIMIQQDTSDPPDRRGVLA